MDARIGARCESARARGWCPRSGSGTPAPRARSTWGRRAPRSPRFWRRSDWFRAILIQFPNGPRKPLQNGRNMTQSCLLESAENAIPSVMGLAKLGKMRFDDVDLSPLWQQLAIRFAYDE